MKTKNINVIFEDDETLRVYFVINFKLDQLKSEGELQALYNDERLANDDFEFSNWLNRLIETKQIKSYKVLDTWLINY